MMGRKMNLLEDFGLTIIEKEKYNDPCVLEEVMEELYHGAKLSIFAATILIITLCMIHGVNKKFVDTLFTLFH